MDGACENDSPRPSGCSACPGPAPARRPDSEAPLPGPPRPDGRNQVSPAHTHTPQLSRRSIICAPSDLPFKTLLTWTEKPRRWQFRPLGRRVMPWRCWRSASSKTARGGKRRSSISRLNQTAAGREEFREAHSSRHGGTHWIERWAEPSGARRRCTTKVWKTCILLFGQEGATKSVAKSVEMTGCQ